MPQRKFALVTLLLGIAAIIFTMRAANAAPPAGGAAGSGSAPPAGGAAGGGGGAGGGGAAGGPPTTPSGIVCPSCVNFFRPDSGWGNWSTDLPLPTGELTHDI
jgi:hypothetical protein